MDQQKNQELWLQKRLGIPSTTSWCSLSQTYRVPRVVTIVNTRRRSFHVFLELRHALVSLFSCIVAQEFELLGIYGIDLVGELHHDCVAQFVEPITFPSTHV